VPKLFNLRTDPYEFADTTSNTYYEWFFRRDYIVFAINFIAVKWAETFKEFPPIQKPNTFTIDDAIGKMNAVGGGG
jgi:arylsulfatase